MHKLFDFGIWHAIATVFLHHKTLLIITSLTSSSYRCVGKKKQHRENFSKISILINLLLGAPESAICPNCTKIYKHKRNLWRHLKYECGVDPQFSCQICGKYFKYKQSMQDHIYVQHSTDPNNTFKSTVSHY